MVPIATELRNFHVAFFLLLLTSCGVFATTPPESQQGSTSSTSTLLADNGGEIDAIAISINSARRAALRNAELISNIVNGLPSGIKTQIITNDRAAFIIGNNPSPDKISFVDVPYSNPITIWTQDPFLVLQSGDKTTLLQSREFERAGDSIMAKRLAETNGYSLKQSDLYFEGGNIVSDNEFIFIGANTIRYNALQLGINEVEVVLRFQAQLGKPVLVIGPLPQPIAHIDMIITPLGDGRVAVADAGEGARIAEKELENNPETVRKFESDTEANFFGHPVIKNILNKDGIEIRAPELNNKTQHVIKKSKEIAPVLDGIAKSLEDYGYYVERIPFLYGGPELIESGDDKPQTEASYPMLTYNNVLLEQREVYLPRYGWKQMDKEAMRAWTAIGFNTHPIEGLTVSAMYGGALRCSVKVLKRKTNK